MKTEKLPRGIRRRGKKLYAYLTFPDGTFQLRVIGNVTVDFAETQRRIWEREIDESRYVKPKPRTDLVSFADICDRAVEHYKNYTRAWDGIEGRVAVFKQWWPGRMAESITTEEIDAQLLANVAPRGLKWTKCTSNEYRITLLRIFALASKVVNVNPAKTAKRYKNSDLNERTRELSFKEEDDLRAAIRKLYPHKEPEFDLALHLGCRRSNLYGQRNRKRAPMEPLQWKDVNLDFRQVTFTRSKSGKYYRVPINDTALAAFKKLQERGDGTGSVIRKPRPTKTRSEGRELFSSRRWFEACLAEAKITDFHFHDLRHTMGSRLREANVQHEDIGYLLGHGTKSITMRYAHPPMDLLRAAVAKLDRKPQTQTDTKTDTPTVLQFKSA
jgi:integrase